MIWSRSETLALAAPSCTHCFGLGMRTGRRGHSSPCNCVFRAIFRACYERFRVSVEQEVYITRATLDFSRGRDRRYVWGRKDEEYAADFCLVSRRTLTEAEYRIFRYHFLLCADWKLCCRKLGMDRGNFFHAVYRIMQKLGRTFRELEPYPLYPLDEYFGGVTHSERAAAAAVRVIESPPRRMPKDLEFPRLKAA